MAVSPTPAPAGDTTSVWTSGQDPRYPSLCHKEPAKGKKCP